MRLGKGEFRRCGIAGGGGIKGLAGRDPEPAISIEIAVLPFDSGENVRQFGARCLALEDIEQARGQRQLVALAWESHGLD